MKKFNPEVDKGAQEHDLTTEQYVAASTYGKTMVKFGDAYFETDPSLGQAITQDNTSDEHSARHPTEKPVSNYCASAADHMVTEVTDPFSYA